MGVVSSYVLSDQSTWAFKIVLGFCYLPFFLCSCWCCCVTECSAHEQPSKAKAWEQAAVGKSSFSVLHLSSCGWGTWDKASRNSWLELWSCILSSSARLTVCLSSPCACFIQRARIISGSGAAVQGGKKLLDHHCHSLIVLQRKADVKDWVLALLFSLLV